MKFSSFEVNVFKLAGGTLFAQGVSFVVLPIISRFYTPEDFGFLTLALVSMNFLGIFYVLKYDQAIILPKNDSDAIDLVYGCLLMAGSMVIPFTLLFMSGVFDFVIADYHQYKILWFLIPLISFFQCCVLVLQNWNIRKKNYGRISILKSVDATVFGAMATVAGPFNFSPGLVLARFASQIIPAMLYLRDFVLFRKKASPFLITRIKSILMRYRYFPFFLFPGAVLNKGAVELNMFLYSYFFVSREVGLIAFALRVLSMPASLISISVGNVFKVHAATDIAEHGSCQPLFLSTAKKLASISIIPFAILFLFSPFIFEFVFGNGWFTAGQYAQILIPTFFLQFVVSPLSTIFIVKEKQKTYLIWQLALFVFAFGSISIGGFYRDIFVSLYLYSGCTSFMYIVNLIQSYKLASK